MNGCSITEHVSSSWSKLSQQLLLEDESGTNCSAAQPQSEPITKRHREQNLKDDFVHKLQIALKEMRESHYWLRLLIKAQTLPSERLADLLDEATQLRAMLSKAVATAKGKEKGTKSELLS